MSSACAGLLMRLLAPALSTAVRASMPISAVSAMMGRSSNSTSLMYLRNRWVDGWADRVRNGVNKG